MGLYSSVPWFMLKITSVVNSKIAQPVFGTNPMPGSNFDSRTPKNDFLTTSTYLIKSKFRKYNEM